MSDNRNQDLGSRPEYGARPPRSTPDEIPRRGYDRTSPGRSTQKMPSPPLSTSGRRAQPQPQPEARPHVEPGPVHPAQTTRSAPVPPPPVVRGKRRPRDSGLYLPWWSLVILIVFVGVAAFGLLAFVLSLGNSVLVSETPQILIVTSNPSFSQQNNSIPPTAIPPTVATTAPDLPTVAPTLTPLPGGCLLNSEVIVFNTGGVGLNLRDQPSGEVSFIAPEGDRMLVIDGPQFFDGVNWCQVRSTRNTGVFGWASLEFLIAADAIDGAQ